MNEQAYFKVEGLHKNFGGLAAVNDLTFEIEKGAIHGLIGPNGAGKTTIFNVITGFYRPSAGKILYEGESIGGLQPHRVAAKGLVRTFQETTLFQELTVLENVLVGRHLHAKVGLMSALLGTNRRIEKAAEERARETLDFMGLASREDEITLNLPHGHQRALGIAIALAAEPKFLLLDEPFTGMNPEETRRMMAQVEKVRDRGVTVLLVEHDMQAVMGLCSRITVLNFGQLLAEGGPREIQNHPAVIEAYLGIA